MIIFCMFPAKCHPAGMTLTGVYPVRLRGFQVPVTVTVTVTVTNTVAVTVTVTEQYGKTAAIIRVCCGQQDLGD